MYMTFFINIATTTAIKHTHTPFNVFCSSIYLSVSLFHMHAD